MKRLLALPCLILFFCSPLGMLMLFEGLTNTWVETYFHWSCEQWDI